jgi:hypothetical protein
MKRFGIALAIATALGLFIAVPALAAPSAVPDCYPNCTPTGSVSDNSPTPGQTITVTGGNFCPNSQVTVLFDGEEIGHGQADGSGQFSDQVTIPADATLGHHVITLSGLASDCKTPATVEIPITVVSGAEGGAGGGGGGEGGGVAFAGANISLGMLVLAAMVIIGAASLIVGRRRKVGAIK